MTVRISRRTVFRAGFFIYAASYILLFVANSLSGYWLDEWKANEDLRINFYGGSNLGHSAELPTNHNEQIRWRPFHADPATHNMTVGGMDIPGPFYDGRLYLLGARFTTSYEDADDRVSFTLFGFPGDFWMKEKSSKKRCKPHSLDGRLLHYQEAFKTINLFAYIECSNCVGGFTKQPIPLENIDTTVSIDSHQNGVTLIWNADFTPWLSRPQLEKLEQITIKEDKAMSLRIWLWMEDSAGTTSRATNGNATSDTTVNAGINMNSDTMQQLALIDIPLSTRVIGSGGPTIGKLPLRKSIETVIPVTDIQQDPSSSNKQSTSTRGVSLCVAIYGMEVQKYLPQFIQHHLNLQFDHVIIGLDANSSAAEVEHTKSIVAPYLEDGTAAIAVTGIPHISCEVNIQKIHFYNTCLYHSKGLTEYMGIWDIDEFWMPPKLGEERLVVRSDRGIPANLQLDPSWKASNYTGTMTIMDSLGSIHEYQSRHGCADEWCYHSFLSKVVLRRRDPDNNRVNRTHLLSRDFEFIEDDYDYKWSKSVTRTKMAFMAGIHIPGSCRRENHTKLMGRRVVAPYEHAYDDKFEEHCYNLRTDGFGDVYHHYSMARERKYDDYISEDDFAENEYASLFSHTVEAQLRSKELLNSSGLPRFTIQL